MSEALQETGSTPPPQQVSVEGVEDALLDGDLSNLSPQQRLDYYEKVCESVGLNPLTKPFEYIRLNGQLTLYAKRDAAEQLRRVHGISITDLEETWRDSLCVMRAYAKTAEGRTDVATGAVDTSRSSGQDLANDIMKAETKAKRRVTLSLAGLGWLDETEVQDIPDNATEEVQVDYETGEVVNAKSDSWYEEAIDWLADRDATWTDVIDYADRVPTREHPLKDWPDQWWDRAKESVAATDPNDDLGIGEPTDPEAASDRAPQEYDDVEHALHANFLEAWKTEANAGGSPITEDQLSRLYAIADEHEWDEAGLNRMIKDELGWDSKANLPDGDPYEEVCAALEDERLRYHMHRDPDTPDMFEDPDEDNSVPF